MLDVYVLRMVERNGGDRGQGTEDNISKGRVTTHVHKQSSS